MIPYNKDFWRWLFSAIGTSRTLHPGTQRKFWAMENSVAEVASGCEMHALDNIKIADASMANFQKVVLDKDVTVGMSAYGNYSTTLDRKSTRLNSSHQKISYAVFCLK